jgi:AraC-like DNA-binding protein
MNRLRENIVFGSGTFYRLERWNGDDRCVKIINGPAAVDRVPAYGARWHYHGAIELTCILRGTSTCFVADRLQQFSAGEVFMLGENVPHYWHHPRGSEGLSILWEFPEGHGIWDFGDVKTLRLLAQRALRGLSIGGTTSRTVCRRVEELAEMEGLQRLGGLFQLFHLMLHAAPADVRLVAERPFDLTGIDEQEEAIRRALSYIHANYHEPITLADLLRVTCMSRTTFSRKFTASAHVCFSAYLNRLRLQAVCRELLASSHAIGTIAMDHGFTQLSFFNRIFRREMGVSPKQYRLRGRAARVA